MNFSAIEKIADAVLYEGYILYPYRPSSIKNQQRWNFGTLFPRDFALAQKPHESWCFRAEVIVQGTDVTRIDARVRFLHLIAAEGGERGWDEGFARFRTVEDVSLEQICNNVETHFDFDVLTEAERQTAPAGFSARGCAGKLTLSAERLQDGVYRLNAVFANETHLDSPGEVTRKVAQASSFTSAHLLLHVSGGALVSALGPSPDLAAAVAACHNQGVFPVLAGDPGDRSRMLVSPIILYDYPQIAPESTGDFFDGTEMDEMLALRVMTLTDAEQDEMRRSDPHARAILERMETLPKEHLLKVHGAVRGMRPLDAPATLGGPATPDLEGAIQPWNPFEERPPIDVVRIFGVAVRKGDRVRIWPQKKADIMDIAMEGKAAVVESIVQDLEDRIQLAVVLDDDPGRDLGLMQKAGHRFFFTPEEIEPLGVEAL
jgi:hypothetical protein